MSFKLTFQYEVSSWCIFFLSLNAIGAQIGFKIKLGNDIQRIYVSDAQKYIFGSEFGHQFQAFGGEI